nr:MAG TPA: hypothetical protein [Caudoviricetes sp.]
MTNCHRLIFIVNIRFLTFKLILIIIYYVLFMKFYFF